MNIMFTLERTRHQHIPTGAVGALRCAAGPARECSACLRVAPASEMRQFRILAGSLAHLICRDTAMCAARIHRLYHVPGQCRDCVHCRAQVMDAALSGVLLRPSR